MKRWGWLLLVLCACRSAPLPGVDLQNLQPLDTTAREGLRIVVAGILSPQEAEPYRQLGAALGQRLGQPVEVVQRRTYAEVLEVLRSGQANLGFLCTLAAGKGVEEGYLRIVLASQPPQQTPYQSLILVPFASAAQSLADLKGQTFAFTDPLSNTGAAQPRLLLHQMGTTPERFFNRLIYTYTHDRAVWAVAEGFVDGAAVDSLVYWALLAVHPQLRNKLRVVYTAQPDPPPPVVVPANQDTALSAQIKTALLDLAQTPSGQTLLQRLHLRGFQETEASPYLRLWLRVKGLM